MDTVVKIITLLTPHWPFLSILLIDTVVFHVLEVSVFTRAATFTGSPRWLWIWGRKLLPLMPIAVGLLIALVWPEPEPHVATLTQRITYFAAAGALSIFAYDVIVGLARKQGVDLRATGETNAPPPAGASER